MIRYIFIFLLGVFGWSCSGSHEDEVHRQNLLNKLEDQSSFIEMQIPLYLEQIKLMSDSIDNRNEASRLIFWKIAVNTSLDKYLAQPNSEYAFVDLWVFSKQLSMFFDQGSGIGYFNGSQPQILKLTRGLSRLISERASIALSKEEYESVKSFVEKESSQYSIENILLVRPSIKDSWFNYIGRKIKVGETPKVNLPLVLSNASDRVNAKMNKNATRNSFGLSDNDDNNPLLEEFRRKVLLDSIQSKVSLFLNSKNNHIKYINEDKGKLEADLKPYIASLQNQAQVDADRQEGFIVKHVNQIVERISNSFWTNLNDTINRIFFIIVGVGLLVFAIPFILGMFIGRVSKRD